MLRKLEGFETIDDAKHAGKVPTHFLPGEQNTDLFTSIVTKEGMKGLRIFDRFGFNLPTKGKVTNIANES